MATFPLSRDHHQPRTVLTRDLSISHSPGAIINVNYQFIHATFRTFVQQISCHLTFFGSNPPPSPAHTPVSPVTRTGSLVDTFKSPPAKILRTLVHKAVLKFKNPVVIESLLYYGLLWPWKAEIQVPKVDYSRNKKGTVSEKRKIEAAKVGINIGYQVFFCKYKSTII